MSQKGWQEALLHAVIQGFLLCNFHPLLVTPFGTFSLLSLCIRLSWRPESCPGKFSLEVTHIISSHIMLAQTSPIVLIGRDSGNVGKQSVSGIDNSARLNWDRGKLGKMIIYIGVFIWLAACLSLRFYL